MPKTDTVYMRINPKLKADCETVLSKLGLTTNDAINVFLNQVVLHRGLPFEIKMPALSREEAEAVFMAKINEGIKSLNEEQPMTINQLIEKLSK
jgi:addiction module RelB/DinJ family antitoxin